MHFIYPECSANVLVTVGGDRFYTDPGFRGEIPQPSIVVVLGPTSEANMFDLEAVGCAQCPDHAN
jgi:hypothetical protein